MLSSSLSPRVLEPLPTIAAGIHREVLLIIPVIGQKAVSRLMLFVGLCLAVKMDLRVAMPAPEQMRDRSAGS
jgi:hypothetical protein